MKVFPSLLMLKLFTYLPLPKRELASVVPVVETAERVIGVHPWAMQGCFIPVDQL